MRAQTSLLSKTETLGFKNWTKNYFDVIKHGTAYDLQCSSSFFPSLDEYGIIRSTIFGSLFYALTPIQFTALFVKVARNHFALDGRHPEFTAPRPRSMIRNLELFSLVLPKALRDKSFTPAFNDLQADFLYARRFKGRWACRWISFSFVVRSLLMIIDTTRVGLGDQVMKWGLRTLCEAIKRLL